MLLHLCSLGVTHKKEWDSFVRATQNRKSFPCELSSYLIKGKQDLFAAWLDAGRNWDEAKMILKRTQSSSTEGLSGYVATKGKQLVADYGQTKADVLMKRRVEQGLYYDDEDFKDDPLERYYYMKKAHEMNRRHVVEDSSTLQTGANLDNDMIRSLTDEAEGVMRAGALPNMPAVNQKALYDGIADGGVQAAPKKRPKKTTEGEGSEPAKPKTTLEKASDLMAEILAESTSSRKKSMALGAVSYAGDLSKQLLDHSAKMEKHYKTLQKAVTEKVDDEDFYKKAFAAIEKDRAWFKTADSAADSILSGLRRASKKKDVEKKEKKPKKNT